MIKQVQSTLIAEGFPDEHIEKIQWRDKSWAVGAYDLGVPCTVIPHMALLEKELVIRRSTLPRAGKGLFTKKFIPRGTRIVEYKGRITTWKEVSGNGHSSRYIFYVKRNHVIDAEHHRKAIARFANDAAGLTKVTGIRNNAYYEQDGLRIFITAKKDIPAGSEILVDYGKEYWRAIRYNNKMAKTATN